MQKPKDVESGLTAEHLRKILKYDRESGIFYWKERLSIRTSIGKIAGTHMQTGYITIGIGTIHYLAHRLAWLYETGKWPVSGIDHINGHPSDNRFSNLREATSAENHWNMKMFSNNTSGARGVWWSKPKQRWMAEIWYKRKKICLGQYVNKDDAERAYLEARSRLFGEFDSRRQQESVS